MLIAMMAGLKERTLKKEEDWFPFPYFFADYDFHGFYVFLRFGINEDSFHFSPLFQLSFAS